MATKKFIIEVEEGWIKCSECPFREADCTGEIYNVLDCSRYNLSTIKIKELEETKDE